MSFAVALVAGLAGGMLARYIAPPAVFAQANNAQTHLTAQTPVTNEIRAQSFVLVDRFNEVVGTFTAEPTSGAGFQPQPRPTPGPGNQGVPPGNMLPMRIVLQDAKGHEMWGVGGTTIRPLTANVR